MNKELLSDVKKGRVKIVSIDGHKLAVRLTGMGIVVGKEVEVYRNDGRGPVIIKSSNTRVGLGRGMSNKIYVKEIEENS